jgi:hypothetical protein
MSKKWGQIEKIVGKNNFFKTWWSGLGKITQKCDFLQGYGVLG